LLVVCSSAEPKSDDKVIVIKTYPKQSAVIRSVASK
jgi:hypothetical protein